MLIIKKIKNFDFSIFFVFILFTSIIISNVSAEDLQINEECINNVLTLTVSDSAGPINGISAYIYKDTSMEKISDKMISNKTGKINFNFSDQTTMIKIIKENHEDITKNLVCNEEFRIQSVKLFSVVDSSIGIIEDPNTELSIVDLGTFYGIAGNGTTPDTIKVYRDNILWKTTTKETGIAPSTSHSEWQIPQTFFYNELPGKYKIVLITDNTETLVFEFMVKQITEEFEENSENRNMKNDHMEKNNENIINSKIPPLKQIAKGISPEEIVCKEGRQLVYKNTDSIKPVCVKPTTVDKLIERNWAKP